MLVEQRYTLQRALLDGEKFIISETFQRKNLKQNTVGLERQNFKGLKTKHLFLNLIEDRTDHMLLNTVE